MNYKRDYSKTLKENIIILRLYIHYLRVKKDMNLLN